jgi:hypothetical protein
LIWLLYVCFDPLHRRKLSAYKELAARQARHAALARTASHLESQQAWAGKGRKRKLTQGEKAANALEGEAPTQARVFKWRRERQK